MLHSCIVLPPVGHSSNNQYHCCQLTDNRAVFRIFNALLKFAFDSPSYLLLVTVLYANFFGFSQLSDQGIRSCDMCRGVSGCFSTFPRNGIAFVCQISSVTDHESLRVRKAGSFETSGTTYPTGPVLTF